MPTNSCCWMRSQRTIKQSTRIRACTNSFLDNILITASSEEKHLQRLDEVLSRLEEHGVHVKLSKCQFFSEQCGISGTYQSGRPASH